MPRPDKQKSLGDLINEPTKTNKLSFGKQKFQSRIVDDEGPWVSSPAIQRDRSFNRRRWYPMIIIACVVCALLAPLVIDSLPPLFPRPIDVRPVQAEPAVVAEDNASNTDEVAQLFQEGDVGVVLAQIKGGTGDDPFVLTNTIAAYLTEAGIPYTIIEQPITHYAYDKGISVSDAFDATVVVWGHPSAMVENGIDLYYVVTPRDRDDNQEVNYSSDEGYISVKATDADYAARFMVAQVLYHENAIHTAHGYFDGLTAYLANQPQGHLMNLQAGWVYFQSGYVHTEIGQYEAAVSDYTTALQLSPDSDNAYFNRGYVYNQLGEYENALADFDIALTIDPEDPWVYIHRGIAYQELDDPEKALEAYSYAIELDPEYADAYWGRGNLHYELGNDALALADYRRYEELNGSLESYMHWRIVQLEAALEDTP